MQLSMNVVRIPVQHHIILQTEFTSEFVLFCIITTNEYRLEESKMSYFKGNIFDLYFASYEK